MGKKMKYRLITGTQRYITNEIEKYISGDWEICGNMFITGEAKAPNRGEFAAPVYAILMFKKPKPEITLVSPSLYSVKPCLIPDCRASVAIHTIDSMYRVHCCNCAYISGSYSGIGMATDNHNAIYRALQRPYNDEK